MITIAERLNRSLRCGFLEIFGTDELNRFEQESTAEISSAESDLIRIAAYFRKRLSPAEAEGAVISIGKFAFPYIKNEFSVELGFRDGRFRILPLDDRIRTGLAHLVDAVLNPGGIPITTAESNDAFDFIIEAAQLSENEEARLSENAEPLQIALLSGLVLECCADITGGKTYRCQLENRRELRLFKKPIGH